ncbi:hypothetical protein ACROYT_G024340 [Oculina patagonica]
MKRTFLILAVMFLAFDYCWAKKKDADKILLDGNHAKSFLVKRQWQWYYNYVQNTSEHYRESESGVWTATLDVHEECCGEICDTEEMDENMHPGEYSDHAKAEVKRENYLTRCCGF